MPAAGYPPLDGVTAVVAAPLNPVVPVVQLTAPSAVTPCAQTITVQASATNLGNRPASWSWTVSGTSPSQALLDRVAAATSDALAIPDLELAGSASLTFSATAANYVGASSSGNAIISVGAVARPTIQALTSTTPSIVHTNLLVMQVFAKAPTCLGTPTPVLQWTAAPPGAIPVGVATNISLLVIPGGTLAPGDTPTYTATASIPALGTSASIDFDVTVEHAPLVAVIAGPATIVVRASSDHPLNASGSYDPDDPAQTPAPLSPSKVQTGDTFWRALAGALAPGTSYTVTLATHSTCGSDGLSSLTFVTNAPPSGGSCEVVEAQPLTVGQSFTVSCSGFTDPEGDNPLSYQVFRDDGGVRTALGSASASNSKTVLLGSLADTLVIRVADSRGYATSASINITMIE